MDGEKTLERQGAMVEALTSLLSEALLSNDNELIDKHGFQVNIVDGLVYGLVRIASALKWLGLGDAGTPFGAIEALCVELKESSERVASGLHDIADAIRDK